MNVDRGYRFLKRHPIYNNVRERDKTIENSYFAGLIEMVEKVKREKLHGGDIDLLKSIYYDMIWGVQNDPNETPEGLSIVGYKPQEDLYGENNPYQLSLSVYVDKDVYRYTRLNYQQWIELPPYMQRQIIKVCDEKNKSTDAEAKKLTEEFKNLNGDD